MWLEGRRADGRRQFRAFAVAVRCAGTRLAGIRAGAMKRNTLTRPRPETTASTSTRPWLLVRNSTSASSRGVARREVGVAALRGRRRERPVDVVQQGLAEARAGGEDRAVARRHGDAFLQHQQFVGLEHGHGRGHGLEVVDQTGAAAADAPRDRAKVGHPRARSSAARPAR